MANRRVTSNDVAEYAGVSRATVSAVLNKTRPVSEELVERVNTAMRDLNYQPDAIARSLKANRSYRIGLLVGNVASPFWATAINVVEGVASAEQFHVILGDNDDDPKDELAHLRMLSQERVDGIILAPCGEANRETILQLAQDIPIVLFDRHLSSAAIDSVACDNELGAYLAVSHLIEEGGHREIACLSLNPEYSTAAERLAGYQKALLDHRIPINPHWIKLGNYTEESGYQDSASLLRSSTPPRAIFATSHLKAIGVLRAAKELRIEIPKDLALIGYDEMPWSEFLCPPLTTIAQPVAEMARQAAELLVRRIRMRWDGKKEPEVTQRLLHRPKLIHRESCGCGVNLDITD